MVWLANTPSHKKREGFFIADKEVARILCRSVYNAMIKILFISKYKIQ